MSSAILVFLYAFGPFDSGPYLTPTDVPQTSVIINWNTSLSDSSMVAYGLTPDLDDTVRFSDTVCFHHVPIGGLTPGSEYYYRILPDGPLKTFRTFPASVDSFCFFAMGDTRTDSTAHQSVIDRIATFPGEFVTSSGDLVENGDSESEWRTFFNIEDTLLQSAFFLPAIGNHESPYWPYDTLFPLPDSEDYYSADYANAHIISLNTSIDLYGDQRTWLESDLAAASVNPALDWIFVNLHRPPYSSGAHGSQLDVQDAWCPLFEAYGVDIVFCGHDHDYERTYPINGVIYIVTGGGGAPLRGVGTNLWTAYSESTYQFCHVKIKGRVLSLTAIKPDGTVFDSLILDKTIGINDRNDASRVTGRNLLLVPNPFIGSLRIKFRIPNAIFQASLKIYNAAGRLVRQWDHETMRQTDHVAWSGLDDEGRRVPSGTYFVVLGCGEGSTVRSVVVLR